MGRSLDDLPQNGRLHQQQLSLVRKAGAARFIDHVRRPCSRILQSGMPRQVRTGDPTLRGKSGRTSQIDASLNRASRLRPGRDQPYRRARRYSASRLARRRYRGGAPAALRAGSQRSGGRPRRFDQSKSDLVPWRLTARSRYGSIRSRGPSLERTRSAHQARSA